MAAGIFLLALYFTCASLMVILAHVGIIECCRRRQSLSPPVGDKSRRSGDGLFVLHEWTSLARECVSVLILCFFALPALIFVVAYIFGGVMALAEGWIWSDAFEYILCNMVAVGPLVTLKPTSVIGLIIDIVVSMWSLLLTTTLLGLAACINLSTRLTAKIPCSPWGLIRTLFIYVPLGLLIIASICGVILAAAESWAVGDGMLFMVGALCGMETPLTDASPSSDKGVFFTTICFMVEMSIGGYIIGIIGTHPYIKYLLILCEGEISDEGDVATGAESEENMREGSTSIAPIFPAKAFSEQECSPKALETEQEPKLQEAEPQGILAARSQCCSPEALHTEQALKLQVAGTQGMLAARSQDCSPKDFQSEQTLKLQEVGPQGTFAARSENEWIQQEMQDLLSLWRFEKLDSLLLTGQWTAQWAM